MGKHNMRIVKGVRRIKKVIEIERIKKVRGVEKAIREIKYTRK